MKYILRDLTLMSLVIITGAALLISITKIGDFLLPLLDDMIEKSIFFIAWVAIFILILMAIILCIRQVWITSNYED